MIVVGLDIASHVGMARIDSDTGEIVGKCVSFNRQQGFQRYNFLAKEVKRTLSIWDPDEIFVEGYAVYRASSVVTVVAIGTMVRHELYNAGYLWTEVPPSVLKKWVSGKGNASKEEMAVAVSKRWGYNSGASKADDIIDAVGLAQLGVHLVGRGEAGDPTIKGLSPGWMKTKE